MSVVDKNLAGAVKTEKGIELKGIVLTAIIDKCEGCDRVRLFEDQKFCSAYPVPEKKWITGKCNFATHIKSATAKAAKVNPLKASKRAAKGK